MIKSDVASQSIEWISRTLTILGVMLGPCLAGNWLDQRYGTKYWALTGLAIGLILSTYILLLLARKLTPPARGEPIPFEDEVDEAQDAPGRELEMRGVRMDEQAPQELDRPASEETNQ